MKLDLSELASEIGKIYHYDVNEDCADYEDLRCVEPITGSMDFTNAGELIIVRGNLSTKVEIDCSRCLETVTLPVVVKVEEQLPIALLPVPSEGQEEEESLEDESESFFKNEIFDLSEYIRQMVLVEMPIRPLCKDVCQGLCPTCGGNLNEGPCACPVTVESSPFSVLADILKDEEDQKEES